MDHDLCISPACYLYSLICIFFSGNHDTIKDQWRNAIFICKFQSDLFPFQVISKPCLLQGVFNRSDIGSIIHRQILPCRRSCRFDLVKQLRKIGSCLDRRRIEITAYSFIQNRLVVDKSDAGC